MTTQELNTVCDTSHLYNFTFILWSLCLLTLLFVLVHVTYNNHKLTGHSKGFTVKISDYLNTT